MPGLGFRTYTPAMSRSQGVSRACFDEPISICFSHRQRIESCPATFEKSRGRSSIKVLSEIFRGALHRFKAHVVSLGQVMARWYLCGTHVIPCASASCSSICHRTGINCAQVMAVASVRRSKLLTVALFVAGGASTHSQISSMSFGAPKCKDNELHQLAELMITHDNT